MRQEEAGNTADTSVNHTRDTCTVRKILYWNNLNFTHYSLMGWTESQISFTYQRHMTFTPPINEYSKKFQLFAHFFCQCTSSSEKTYIGEKYQLFLLLSVCYVKCCNYYYYYYYFYKVEDKTVNIPPPLPQLSYNWSLSLSHQVFVLFHII